MPIIKCAGKLVYYAHVPKCGGSAVAQYLRDRFGPLAFNNPHYLDLPDDARWTRTSPQHVDAATLGRMFPQGFFDEVFTIVRHPVARLVSAFHFQHEVWQTLPAGMTFSDWLAALPAMRQADPFAADNHIRPMAEIVPADAMVFHMEHGLDGLIPWLDAITGTAAGPRAIAAVNERGAHRRVEAPRARPSEADLATIARDFAVDFDRFGYAIDQSAPVAPAPELTDSFLRARERSRRRQRNPMARVASRLRRRLLA